jgi:hypothetical protein
VDLRIDDDAAARRLRDLGYRLLRAQRNERGAGADGAREETAT